MANTYCPHYHIDCRDKVDIHQCWRVFLRTNDPNSIYHCGCEGDKKRCDFEKIGGVQK